MLQKLSDDLFQMLQMHSFLPSTDSIYEPAQVEIVLFKDLQRGLTLSPTNYCLVLIACSSMYSEQTYQQKCGGYVLRTALKFPVPSLIKTCVPGEGVGRWGD